MGRLFRASSFSFPVFRLDPDPGPKTQIRIQPKIQLRPDPDSDPQHWLYLALRKRTRNWQIVLLTYLYILKRLCYLSLNKVYLAFFKYLFRSVAERGIYPTVDPLDSTSRIMDPNVIGYEHYDGLNVLRPPFHAHALPWSTWLLQQQQPCCQRCAEAAAGLQVPAGHYCLPGYGRVVWGRQAEGCQSQKD